MRCLVLVEGTGDALTSDVAIHVISSMVGWRQLLESTQRCCLGRQQVSTVKMEGYVTGFQLPPIFHRRVVTSLPNLSDGSGRTVGNRGSHLQASLCRQLSPLVALQQFQDSRSGDTSTLAVKSAFTCKSAKNRHQQSPIRGELEIVMLLSLGESCRTMVSTVYTSLLRWHDVFTQDPRT